MARLRSKPQQLSSSCIQVLVEWDGSELSMGQALALLAENSEFRNGLGELLRQAPFASFFWETPSVSKGSVHQPFEYTLTDAPGFLSVVPEPQAFREHFVPDSQVVTFQNLGRDATLVVPCPVAADHVYTHLAAFLRGASETQIDALLRAVGQAALHNLNDRPQWLSTAGMGVHWLHVRIDKRPKYYRHTPYKSPRT